MFKRIVWLFCFTELVVAAILIFQPYIDCVLIPGISWYHPWDYLAHFLTCCCGVIFFFGLWRNWFCCGMSMVAAIIIMLAFALFKELVLDPVLSREDMIANGLGMMTAFMPAIFLFKK